MRSASFLSILLLLSLYACQPDRLEEDPFANGPQTTPIEFEIPRGFAPVVIPPDNPLTEEGVRLGRHLFYEKRLSGDNSMSCGTCHLQDFNFAEPNRFSTGITGAVGDKNAMVLSNLAWQSFFFWDGRRESLEAQAIDPVENPIEMHEQWPNAIQKLESDPLYQRLFKEAFGDNAITKENAAKAIAQFERTMVSADSKFDQYLRGEVSLTQQELLGLTLFNNEQGDCFHCHSFENHGGIFGGFGPEREVFKNNGIDSVLKPMSGREAVTLDSMDRGKFKVPSLRNVEFSFPYMHDGRFANLQEVIEFYNMGGYKTYTLDPNMKKAGVGRNWTQEQKDALLAFLRALSDPSFITDTSFSDPFK